MKQSTWWKDAIAYQIYPRSFKDSNGDGIGDLRGIIQKLDYLKDLGIDVIWICPMYKSPNDDNGYDISDYQDIMDEFGTMADFDALLHAVHAKGMKLIIDLVINHTSDEHPWFLESRSSRDNPKRDWYVWRDGKENEPPNNWESIFKGSAWEKDETTDAYFLHVFSKRQPDLNWENKEVRDALYAMVNWWLDKGIDGFRVDAISHIKKEEGLVDMPNPNGKTYVECFSKMMNVPGIETFIQELKNETFAKYDIMTVGEANGVKTDNFDLWVGEENGAFNMIFQFDHTSINDATKSNAFDVANYRKAMHGWQDALYGKAWNALFIENHDQPRVTSKWGNTTSYWEESAKTLALSYFMQQGTPFIYQGQEIGMTNTTFTNVDDFDDVGSINGYYSCIEDGMTPTEALAKIAASTRDNSRTPMQWDNSPYAGFTDGDKTWFQVNANYETLNVEAQIDEPSSIFSFYKSLIHIRKNDKTLTTAPCHLLMPTHSQIYAYVRAGENVSYVVMCNMSNEEALYDDTTYALDYTGLLLSTHTSIAHEVTHKLTLKPWESRLYKVQHTL